MRGPFDLEAAVRGWTHEGIISSDQATRILERHADDIAAARREKVGHGWLTQILYAGAGIILGAAAIAFVLLGLNLPEDQDGLLVVGLLLAAAGATVAFTVKHARGPLFADTLFIASYIPLVASMVGYSEVAYSASLLVVAAAVLAWRFDNDALAFLSVAAFSVGGAGFFNIFGESQEVLWASLQGALLVGVIAVDRFLAQHDRAAPAVAAVVALAVAFVIFLFDSDAAGEDWVAQALLGLLMFALLGVGILLSHKGLVVGAVAVLGGDAIWFGFSTGGPFTGTVVLLAVAGLLVWQAEWLREHFTE